MPASAPCVRMSMKSRTSAVEGKKPTQTLTVSRSVLPYRTIKADRSCGPIFLAARDTLTLHCNSRGGTGGPSSRCSNSFTPDMQDADPKNPDPSAYKKDASNSLLWPSSLSSLPATNAPASPSTTATLGPALTHTRFTTLTSDIHTFTPCLNPTYSTHSAHHGPLAWLPPLALALHA